MHARILRSHSSRVVHPASPIPSFRSTLDEALEASLLLQTVDAADPAFRAQMRVPREVLDEIGAGDVPWLLVLNKIDKVVPAGREGLAEEIPGAGVGVA